jgi:hypothetical protein
VLISLQTLAKRQGQAAKQKNSGFSQGTTAISFLGLSEGYGLQPVRTWFQAGPALAAEGTILPSNQAFFRSLFSRVLSFSQSVNAVLLVTAG